MLCSFISNLSPRKTASLSIILSAAAIYNSSDRAIVLLDKSLIEDSMLIISQFINLSQQDKYKWCHLVSIHEFLEAILRDKYLVDEFVKGCLLDRDEFTKVMSRVQLKFLCSVDDIIEQVTRFTIRVSTADIKVVVLDNLSNLLLFSNGGKLSQFISKYALCTSLLQNNTAKSIIFESINALKLDYTRKIVKFLSTRSDNVYIIEEAANKRSK